MLIQKYMDAYTEGVDVCEMLLALQPCHDYHAVYRLSIFTANPEQ